MKTYGNDFGETKSNIIIWLFKKKLVTLHTIYNELNQYGKRKY